MEWKGRVGSCARAVWRYRRRDAGVQCCWTDGEWMVCRNERGASRSARNHGKTMSFEMVVDSCWDGLTVEYRPPTALSEQICRSLQRATIIYIHPPPQTSELCFLKAVVHTPDSGGNFILF